MSKKDDYRNLAEQIGKTWRDDTVGAASVKAQAQVICEDMLVEIESDDDTATIYLTVHNISQITTLQLNWTETREISVELLRGVFSLLEGERHLLGEGRSLASATVDFANKSIEFFDDAGAVVLLCAQGGIVT